MDIILTCYECGHQELGSERRILITKVRMLNHVNRVHPHLDESFKDIVIESPADEVAWR